MFAELLLHVLGADEGQAPLEVGQHVAERLRPVVLRVELQLHREELEWEGVCSDIPLSIQGGPSGRGQAYVDIEIRVAIWN